MKTPPKTLDLEKILGALDREKVKFLLVGGMAAIGHGMNYATTDVDFCYQRGEKNLQAIVRALETVHPQLRVPGGSLPFLFDAKSLSNGLNFTLDTDWGWIDLLGELEGVGNYETLLPRSVKFEFYGVMVDTIGLDDLIRAKETAGRTKDKLHLLELNKIKEGIKI